MLAPLRPNPARRQTASTASVPAPLGGWNARDGLAMMKPSDAVILDNYFPNSGSCDLRGGTALSDLAAKVADGALDPYAAADELLAGL